MSGPPGPDWGLWGPYLAERAWGTVREDYSGDGTPWRYFPHDHARSRAYRWGEDGLAGISDRLQRLCFALALWNGADPFLKERVFGLTGEEGNHGEDAKECWWYLDAVPTHDWLRWRYHYPQRAFPYARLLDENRARTRADPEFELTDTGIFDEDRFWVVEVTYAKRDPTDLLVAIGVRNAGPETATLDVIPTLWFRNTWSWDGSERPRLRAADGAVVAEHPELGVYRLDAATGPGGPPELLFCDNETNVPRLFGGPPLCPHPKDAIGDRLVHGVLATNPAGEGTKAGCHHRVTLAAGASTELRLRLRADGPGEPNPFGAPFDAVMADRRAAADRLHAGLAPAGLPAEEAMVARRALAGMIWTKQFYEYDVARWLDGDPAQPPPPPERHGGRNAGWRHMRAREVLSMPDTWEYPWFASWDLAFQAIALARMDPAFAKSQLLVLLSDRYRRSDGAIPAYEWRFDDLNPPVQAWAALEIHAIDGGRDPDFLGRVFEGLRPNLDWWITREDPDGNSLFSGGFLGLDNISPVNRSELPWGTRLEQSDATAWMAFFCASMIEIAGEIAPTVTVDDDILGGLRARLAAIVEAMEGRALWDEESGFSYDLLHTREGQSIPVRVRSASGAIPLVAAAASHPGVVPRDRLRRLLSALLDEREFLSPHGLRSLSARHRDAPYRLEVGDTTATIAYEPGESGSGMFGGNSNWRGPVWMPLNYLAVAALRRLAAREPGLTVELPTGSGRRVGLAVAAEELRRRIISLYLTDASGRRPAMPAAPPGPDWSDGVTFFEYFHGDDGTGLGASHQTGWTGLIAELILRGPAR